MDRTITTQPPSFRDGLKRPPFQRLWPPVLIPFLRSRTVVVVGHVFRKADFEEAAESPWLRKAEHDELSHGHAVRGWDIIMDLADR